MRILGQLSEGLEELGAAELESLGMGGIQPVYRGVFFITDLPGAMRVNYMSRLFDRFLQPVASFRCSSADRLYSLALEHPWEKLLDNRTTFSISGSVSGGRIRNSRWAALKLKDAIADRFRNATGRRPSVDRRDADVKLDLRVTGSMAEVRLDLSGGALHRRGYRKMSVRAPMRETVAAAALEMSGWSGEKPLADPMCGSGTLLCEALMKYCRIPAGHFRETWGFFRMEGFTAEAWRAVREECDVGIRSLPEGLLSGSDISEKAVEAARANLGLFRDGRRVRVEKADWSNLEGYVKTMILTNPPHGIRLAEGSVNSLLRDFGNFLKRRCSGCDACIYLGDTSLLKQVGLRTSWRKRLVSGGLEGRLARYELY